MNLEQLRLENFKDLWVDTPYWHTRMRQIFDDEVNKDYDLKRLRDWVEQNIWGFGERSFYYMWKLIVDEMPNNFSFLEIGVFRGQILALIRMLSDKQNKIPNILGISPLTNKGGYWESDYEQDIKRIHELFDLKDDYTIYAGDSTNPDIVRKTENDWVPFDIIYIDGGHEYDTVVKDMKNYLPRLKVGGYLVMDDCSNRFNLPDGYFRGHQEVSRAVDEFLPPGTENKEYEYLFNIIHNRVWKKL